MANLEEILIDLKSLEGPIVVLGHSHPDPDCVGSALGLACFLRALGKEAYAMAPEPPPKVMARYLEGSPWVRPSREFLKGKILVSADVATRWMLEPVIADYSVALAIDHHPSHETFAQKTHVLAQATSVSEIVAGLFVAENLKAPTRIAEALYAGFLFDTGRWWWGGVNRDSFKMGLWLADCGVDFKSVSDHCFARVSKGHIRLLQRAFEKVEFICDGAVAIVSLTQEDFQKAQACRYDKEGIVDAIRVIDGVEISVLLKQEQGIIKGSLRAHCDQARLDEFCAQYGGGGHQAAAGLGKGSQEPLESFLPTFRERITLHWNRVREAVLAQAATR